MNKLNNIDNKYSQIKLLGMGTYGTVWEAEQLKSPFNHVAIKIV